jgi:hypothetical protein
LNHYSYSPLESPLSTMNISMTFPPLPKRME